MLFQHVKRAVALCAATVIGVGTLIGFTAGVAAAGTLTSPDGFTTLTTQGTVTAHTPYASGQSVALHVAANSTMNNAALVGAGFPSGAVTIKFLECADPGGTTANLPTKLTGECEPGSIHSISGANSDGSMSTTYQVLELPDVNLGSSNGTVCGLAPNYCVVGIFSNQNDFSKPHLFSAPYLVGPGDGLGEDDGLDPGDGTGAPTAPTAVSAAAGPASGIVTFTAPSFSGPAVSGYSVAAADSTNPAHGGQTATGSASPITVSGLTPGDTYTFKVTATNSAGSGPASSPSNSVVPTVATPVFHIVAPTLPSVTPGVPYGPFTFSVANAASGAKIKLKATVKPPKGIKFKNGALEGTIKVGKLPAGTYSFTITATEKYIVITTTPGSKKPVKTKFDVTATLTDSITVT
jgi:Fibronectin type III domain